MNIKRTNRTNKKELLVDETIFSIANGYIGTRGSFCEGYGTDYEYHQTYINAFYNYYDYHYEENLTGFPQQGQKYVNVFDGTRILIKINGTYLNIKNATLVSLDRDYDMSKGITQRKAHYILNDNNFYITEKRLVSKKAKYGISIELDIYSDDYEGEIEIESILEETHKKGISKDPRIHITNTSHFKNITIDLKNKSIHAETTKSELSLFSTIDHNIKMHYQMNQESLIGCHTYPYKKKEHFIIEKHIVHTTNLYEQNYIDVAKDTMKQLLNKSFFELIQAEEKESTLFWNNSKVTIENNPYLEQLLNFNIYQLNNQGGMSEIHNIGAKGLSGEGYEGHYFWDTEIYMLPFFTLTNPEKAKKLLMYRYHTLEQARKEARALGYKNGIKIPWRTINGEETSPYYPAGSAQFHINSDVAYSIIKYFEVTNDIEFLQNYGYELLIETARFLKEAVNYYDGSYHLNSVTGPDEYTTVVDDNFYTNKMLKYHFKELVYLHNEYKSDLQNITNKLNVKDEEINQFLDISKHISLPFDEELNIFKQDKNFLFKKKLNLKDIPKENFPLLLNYHPLFLYKHQVLKQADTLLALMLLDDTPLDILKDTYNYYEPITTHDSSLSECIYSIIAFRLGKKENAFNSLEKVLLTDYENTHNNTEHGLHVANLGGSYLGFIYGVAGLRIHRNHISLRPQITSKINNYSFTIKYKGEIVNIEVNNDIKITTTGSINLKIYEDIVTIDKCFTSKLEK